MPPSASKPPSMQEQALLNHIQRLERSGDAHLAVQVHLSKLIAFQRLPECMAVARILIDRVAKTHDASLFDLFNKDLFLVYDRKNVSQIDKTLNRLCRILSEDPFFATGPAAEEAFCSHFDFAAGYPEMESRVKSLLAESEGSKTAARAQAGRSSGKKPVSLTDLAAVEKAIAQADLSSMTSRQPICQIDEEGRPQPLFNELFTSMRSLGDMLLPGQDIFADRWLFQYLTTKLDQRMLAWLSKNDDSTLKHSFSLNINIATLLSPRFMSFDGQLDRERRNTIIIELQMLDIFADFERYLFTREFLQGRGYRICVDGVTELSLPYIDRASLGAEFVKLQWSKDLRDQVEGQYGGRLRSAVKNIEAKRIILTRCETDDALELGHELGIGLFQGFFLDHLLSEKITREEAAERLVAALARHRRTAMPGSTAAGS